MRTKTRKQGNSITLTVPKKFNIKEGTVVEARLTKNGIFYEFVYDGSMDFDVQLLEDLIKEGYTDQDLLAEFKKRKKNLPHALDRIVEQTLLEEKVMSKAELEKEIGLWYCFVFSGKEVCKKNKRSKAKTKVRWCHLWWYCIGFI